MPISYTVGLIIELNEQYRYLYDARALDDKPTVQYVSYDDDGTPQPTTYKCKHYTILKNL
jgi:hypothetical protein